MSDQPDQLKQKYLQLFNLISSGYDHNALRFFPYTAESLINFVQPEPDCKILDIATGTGVAAIAAAKTIAKSGRVTAIDQSEKMLEQAKANSDQMALDNIDYLIMDAEHPEFENNYFDHIICSYGIFFLPDMDKALQNWKRVLKPGGSVSFTVFAETSFQPMADLFRQQIEAYGVSFSKTAWQKLCKPDHCQQLLSTAGMCNINIQQKQVGYHLNNADDWWNVLWNSGFRAFLEQLNNAQLKTFKLQHLNEIKKLETEEGLWLDISVLFASGIK